MKRLSIFLIFSLCFNFVCPMNIHPFETSSVKAATPAVLTPLAIITAANKVLGDLRSLSLGLTGEALIITNNLSGELSARIEDLRKLVKEDLAQPLESFGLEIQNLGRQLNSVAEQANFILANQQVCFFKNIEVTMSGLANLTRELKRGIPLVKAGDPRLGYYKFDGQPSNVVPKEGGRLTVFGFKLWDHSNLPPTVEILTDDLSQKLASLNPMKANDGNSLAVMVDKEIISKNPGKCLQLHVRAFTKKFFGGKEEFDLYLPFCVSVNYAVQFKVTAFVSTQYKPKSLPSDGPEMQFLYYNDKCKSGSVINDIRSVPMPAAGRNCRIIAFRTTFANSRNTTHMGMTINSPNTMRASGTLDTATCICPPFVGCRLLHSTFWENKVVPVIQCDYTPDPTTSSGVQVASLAMPTTAINIRMPKSGEMAKDTFWFQVNQIVNGVDTGVIYESARFDTVGSVTSVPAVTVKNFLIDGTYNPTPVNGFAQLTVNIKAPPCNP